MTSSGHDDGDRLLLLGLRLWPSDVQVIQYLYHKTNDLPLPCPDNLILDCDVYDTEPWLLPRNGRNTDGKGAYFYFTRLTKRSRKGIRVKRTAGKGCWKFNKRETVKFGDNVVGNSSQLTYKRLDGKKSNWCMKEFRLDPIYFNPDKDEEMALCRIRNTGKVEAENGHDPQAVISNQSSKKMGAEGCDEDDASSETECDISRNKRIEHEIGETSKLSVSSVPEQKTNYVVGGSQDEEIALCRIRNTGKLEMENGHRPHEVIYERSSKKMGDGEGNEHDASSAKGSELSNDSAQEGSTKYDQVGESSKLPNATLDALTSSHGLRVSIPGFEFQPSDEEAIRWLYAKSHDLPEHGATLDFIFVCDIYKAEPWLLPRNGYKPEVGCFYFSSVTKLRNNQLKRTAGKGRWHMERRKAIKHDGTVIGNSCLHSYKRLDGQKSNWCMQEFRLDPKYYNPNKDEEIALYRIRSTGKAKGENGHHPREISGEHSSKKIGPGECGENDALSAEVCDSNGSNRIESEIGEPSQLTLSGAPEQISNYETRGSQTLSFRPTLPGFKFRPSDDVAIQYLYAKSHDLQVLGPMSFILVCDVYNAEPWLLPNGAYFYLSRIDKLGKKVRRIAGKGCWLACGKRKAIEHGGAVIGQCLPLAYKRQDGKKSNWYMREFRLDPRFCNPNREEIALHWIRYSGKPELEREVRTTNLQTTVGDAHSE